MAWTVTSDAFSRSVRSPKVMLLALSPPSV